MIPLPSFTTCWRFSMISKEVGEYMDQTDFVECWTCNPSTKPSLLKKEGMEWRSGWMVIIKTTSIKKVDFKVCKVRLQVKSGYKWQRAKSTTIQIGITIIQKRIWSKSVQITSSISSTEDGWSCKHWTTHWNYKLKEKKKKVTRAEKRWSIHT